MLRTRYFSAATMLTAASSAARQDSAVTLWKREVINSAKLNEQRSIFVATPAGYKTETDRYPVLILLDGDDQPQFNLAVANAVFLARGALPKLIVVGIANGKDRTHDLTSPTSAAHVGQFLTAGGAAAFSDFIVDEIVPSIRSKYRTLPATTRGYQAGFVTKLSRDAWVPPKPHTSRTISE